MASNAKTIDGTQKTPNPKHSERQVLNIPINADQSRSMAEQMPKNCFTPKQTASTPKHCFFPLFINAKTIDRTKKSPTEPT
jgi:hypothetical protein